MMRRKFIMLVLAVAVPLCYAQEIFPPAGLGSYNLTIPPDDFQGVNTYDEIGGGAAGYAFATMGPGYAGPFETHQWWTSALWNVGLGAGTSGEVWYRGDSHSENMYPLPLQIDAEPEGFNLRYRDNANQVSGANQVNSGPATIDLRVGLDGSNAPETSVEEHGDFHAVFRQEWAGTVLRATGTSGSPYFFLERQGNQDFGFYHQGAPGTINDILVTPTMEAISLTTNTGPTTATFGLFFPPGTLLDGTPIGALPIGPGAPFGSTFTADVANGSNYITVVVLPDNTPATFQDFAQYAWNFITDTDHSFAYDELNSLLTTTFDITTTNVYGQPNTGTLQSMYRHQWLYSPEMSGGSATGYIYPSVRGDMRVIRSNTFTTEMTHLGILPALGWANTADFTTLWNYVDAFSSSLNPMPDVADGYNKDQFTELLNAVQIAQQIGHSAAYANIIGHLRSRLVDWLVADDADFDRYFAYDPNFNWMAHYPNGFGSSGTFVDAHFHVGYFMMAAAAVARYDPTFIADYGDMVTVMARSINDDRKNLVDPGAGGTIEPWFPYLRYFDPYAGHSWADPMANDQESVSEAIHFAAGVFLWGETVQDDQMRDLGALLYITETEAARQYWFDVDASVNGGAHATAYNHRHLTMLYNWGGNYATFFGIEPEYIHGITYIPGTGASTWLGTNIAGAAYNYSEIGENYTLWGGWGQAINVQHATHDPTAAINAFNLYNGMWGNDAKPFTYHWIHTYDSVGLYDATVQANITGFGIFKKDSCNTWYRHYMFYNPPGDPPKTVHATDGTCWAVPADTLVTFALLGPDTIGGINASTTSVCSGDPVTLSLTDYSVCDNDTVVEYQVSTDNVNWTPVQRLSGGNANQIVVNPTGSGTVYYRAVMINDYPSKPEMLCDLNDTADAADVVSITVNVCGCTTPTIAVLNPTGSINLCAPATQNIDVSTDVPAGFEFTWFEVGTGNVNGGPVLNDSSYSASSTGSYYVRVADPVNPAVCFLDSDTLTVNINPAITPNVVISESANPICAGTNVVFTVTDSTGSSAPDFQWQINGSNVGGNSNQFSSSTLTNGDVVRVIMSNMETCATQSADTSNEITMVVDSPLNPDVVISATDTSFCTGTNVCFNIASTIDSGASPTFTWLLNGTNVGTGNQYCSSTISDQDSVQLIMTPVETCVTSTSDTSSAIVLSVVAGLTPNVVITEDVNGICAGDNITFTVIDSAGATNPDFKWQLNGVNTASNSNQFSSMALVNGDLVRVIMSNLDACATQSGDTSNSIVVSVIAPLNPAVSITQDINNVCNGTTICYSSNSATDSGASPTYDWHVNGATISSSAGFCSNTIQNNDTVRLILSLAESCVVKGSDTSNSLIQSILPSVVPNITIASNVSSICLGDPITFNTITRSNQGTSPTYEWQHYDSTSGTWTTLTGPSAVDSVSTSSFDSGDSIRAILRSNEACVFPDSAISNKVNVPVTNNAVPSISVSPTNPQICSGETIVFNATPFNEGGLPAYQWYVNGNPAGTNSTTFSATGLNSGDAISIGLKSSLTCAVTDTANGTPVNVQVNPIPAASISGDDTLCSGSSGTLLANGGSAGSTYEWFLEGLPFGTNSDNQVITQNGNYTVRITSAAFCDSSSQIYPVSTISVNVDAGPDLTINQGDGITIGAVSNGNSFQWTPGSTLNDATALNPIASPTGSITYQLVASIGSCSDSDNVTIFVRQPILIPNVFTPNGDGENDDWEIQGLSSYPDARMTVYNRWGSIVYRSVGSYVPWNGMRNDDHMPIATYYYILDLDDENSLSGAVTIVR